MRRLALALGGLLYAAGVGAQFNGSVSVVSDYRYRGVSLSDQKPAAQASLGYDDPRGGYGGVFASTVELAGDATTKGQALVYVGFIVPLGNGIHGDAGAVYAAFSGSPDYDYGEVYAGIASAAASARVHYSPDYFGTDRGSFYVEANGTHPLGDGVALLGHIGVLVPMGRGDPWAAAAVRNPVDARVGLGVDVAGFSVQAAWVGTNGSGTPYPVYGGQRRNTVVVSVSRSF